MSESSFTNFFNNPPKLFGFNVIPGERTRIQNGETASNLANGAVEPLFSFLEENEYVYSGDLKKDLEKLYLERLKMNNALQEDKPGFDNKF